MESRDECGDIVLLNSTLNHDWQAKESMQVLYICDRYARYCTILIGLLCFCRAALATSDYVSVRPSVKRVNCEKQEIKLLSSMHLGLRHEELFLVGMPPST